MRPSESQPIRHLLGGDETAAGPAERPNTTFLNHVYYGQARLDKQQKLIIFWLPGLNSKSLGKSAVTPFKIFSFGCGSDKARYTVAHRIRSLPC